DKLIKKIEGLLACLQNKGSNSGEDINGCGFDLEYGRFADVLVFDIKQGELLGKDVAIKFAVDVGSGGKEIKEPVKGLFE
ncbi:TPA: hypothetical protein H1005_02250, partial [archaeon]|nr:hypothetical protein [Candidatus Naiadarchaeales archaeon SRR2090153.bin1042]